MNSDMKVNNKKEKNFGIALLRVILAFMVVVDHFYDSKKKNLLILYYHIPTFFLLSFYFTNNYFTTYNIAKIKLRFERLIIPYLCWNIISWILSNIYFHLFNRKCKHSIYDFLHTLLNGHIFIPALWFQNILILTTLIVSIIVFTFQNYCVLIFQIIMILSYVFQYSGMNNVFFRKHFKLFYYNTYGRMLETLPHSISGLFLATYNIPYKLRKHKFKTVIVSSFILILATTSQIDNQLLGFKYGGIRLNIAAICIFFIFFYSLFDKIKNKKIKNLIDNITNFTAGIYYSHYLIGKSYIMEFLLGRKIKTFFGILVIYSTTYFICFFLDKLIGNTKLKHLIK